MDKNIQSQLDRAEELLRDLENAYNDDLTSKNISEKTKKLIYYLE